MTDLMDEAIDASRQVPAEQRVGLAHVVRRLESDSQAAYACSSEEEADLAASEAEADRGEFATDEDIRAIWAKHGL